jgi:capsular polysaccharide biosynthesis protein/Mrp family chromosome partitioning ATPase
MNASRNNDELTLWQLVRRWWWALALAAIAAGLAGYAVASKLPKTYQSTATLLVGPINTDTALDASGSLTATYESLATSQPVLQSAISATGVKLTPVQLGNATTTSSNIVSRLVTISVSYRDPAIAAKLANALSARIAALAQTSTKATNEAIAAFDTEPQVQTLSPHQRNRVESALRQVLGASPAGEVTIVNPGTAASAPSSPKKPLIAVLSALAGLMIAVLLLLGRMSGRRSAADERSLEELDYAFLGTVDVSPARDSASAVSVETRPQSSAAASYRMLATRLSLVEGAPDLRSLLVVDSTDGSAAAVVAANLAAALARMSDQSVVLADVSTEAYGATKLLGLQGHEGFAELIANPELESMNGELAELFVDRGEEVRVLPRGNGELARLPSADRARLILRRVEGVADLVVLAGPPLSKSPSGLIWAREADSVLFVVDESKTSNDEVTRAVRDLSLASGCFLGTAIGRRRSGLPGLRRSTAGRA